MHMLRLFAGLLLALAALSAAGCQVVTRTPVFEAAQAVDEPALAGRWKGADSDEVMIIEKTAPGIFRLSGEPQDKSLEAMGEVRSFSLGEERFVALTLPDGVGPTFARYRIEGDSLTVFLPLPDWFEQQGSSVGAVKEGGDFGSIVLSAEPEAVRAFLIDAAKVAEAWEATRFERE